MKTKTIKMLIVAIAIIAIPLSSLVTGCVSAKVAAKSGSQLWSENCRTCHNTPPANTFSGEQWETVGLHMQSRALLTDLERDKIVNFLKGE